MYLVVLYLVVVSRIKLNVYISLGSNEGCRINFLRQAVSLLKEKKCLKNIHPSVVVETKALLPKDAPKLWDKNYYNAVVRGKSTTSPQDLLKKLKQIECEMGRSLEHQKWSPRIIDLDILLFGQLKIKTKDLTLPHPELKNRIFFQHLLVLMGEKQFGSKINLKDIQENIIKSLVLNPQFVGVVNITKDSFSDGGQYFNPKKALSQCLKLSEDGASIIELGAQSTRPNAIIQSPETEYKTLKSVLKKIEVFEKKDIQISVDSFFPEVIRKIIKEFKVNYINDVSGKLDKDILKMIAKRNLKICIMHSLSVPANPSIVLSYKKNVMKILLDWSKKTVSGLVKLGFDFENIVLDPGIGFGKSAYQNVEILKNLEVFECFRKEGVKLMVGHSRKSYINLFNSSLVQKPQERDLETLAISSVISKNVDFIRVHNVKDHMRFLSVLEGNNEKLSV